MASILRLDGKWRAQIRRKGAKSIAKTFPTKAAAEAWATKIEAQLAQGAPPEGTKHTVGDLVEAYRALRAKARPILDTSNEHYMLNHITEGLGGVEAGRLCIDDLLGWCQMRADEGAGPYTINMELGKLGTVLRYAGAAKRLALPDVVGAARPVLSHAGLIGGGGRRERRTNEDELHRITAHLRTHYGPRYADAVEFAVLTAMRRGEVCGILWADVQEASRLVLVRDRKHPRKKKGNNDLVPLVPLAWEILQRQPKGDARVFPIHPQTLSKYFKATCDALGIPDLHLHDMRHEGTSRLFEAGYSIPEVAVFTGHKSWKELQRYTQLDPAKVRKD